MSQPAATDAPHDERAGSAPSEREVRLDALPALRSPLPPAEAVEALDRHSRRGKLPGFRRLAPDEVSVSVFGEPFDRRLHARFAPDGAGSLISLRARLILRIPIIACVIMLFTIWPGVWLTDSMLLTYYPPAQHWWPTWTWYLPITVIPLPFAAWGLWKRSEAACRREAAIAIDRICEGADASPVTPA